VERILKVGLGFANVRDCSLFSVQGGIEVKLRGALNFFKSERGALKNTGDERRGL
jgi:hypothetical protein